VPRAAFGSGPSCLRVFVVQGVLAAVLGAAAPAAARDPQRHEVRVDLDLGLEREASAADLDAQYTFTPPAIDREDDVPPILRRFVRRPSAIWARVRRLGHSREPVTGAALGGVLHLGPGYAGAEVGVEHDVVAYDDTEHAYLAAPLSVEAGLRPTPRISVGALYSGRFVIGASPDDRLVAQAERSGADHRAGGRLAIATPGDRLFVDVSAWGRVADLRFDGFHPGVVTIRGLGAALRVAFQLGHSLSLGLRGELRRDHWVNGRAGDEDPRFVGPETDRQVLGALGVLELHFWHRGRHGFRVGLGGGYEGAPPTVDSRETGILQISLGVITRF
jgi:hypothetical protein